MYCKNCGKEIDEGVKFCPSCGVSQKNRQAHTEQISPKIEKSIGEFKEQIAKGKLNGKLYMIIGWVSVVISLLFIPVLFGAVGVVMGYLYRDHDEKHGTILMIAGVTGALLGMLLGASSGY